MVFKRRESWPNLHYQRRPKTPMELPGEDRGGDPSPRPGMRESICKVLLSQGIRPWVDTISTGDGYGRLCEETMSSVTE